MKNSRRGYAGTGTYAWRTEGWRRELRLALVLASVAVAVTACGAKTEDAVTPPVVAGQAAPASSADTGDWEATSFASERGISVTEAAFRLRQQQHVGDFGERASAELGTRFGGVWIDVANADRVTLGLSPAPAHASRNPVQSDAVSDTREGADDSDIRELVSAIAIDTQIEDYATVPVAFPYAALEAANAWITDGIVRLNPTASAPLRTGILANQNAIALDLPIHSELNAAQRELVAEAQQRFGAMIRLGSFAPGRPSLDSCSYAVYEFGPQAFCDKPLRGGILIHSPIGNCTGGFIARGNSNGKLYQMTAGHCAQAWSDDWSTVFAHDNSVHVIGNIVSPWIFSSNGDLALLNINNVAGWTPKNWVYVSQGNGTTTDEQYSITSVGSSTQGMRICISGATYGSSNCGHVTLLGVPHLGDFGITFTNLGLADYGRCPGDSGAPVFASHTGYGIHQAGDSEQECTHVAYYQSLKSAEIKLNVRTLTAPP